MSALDDASKDELILAMLVVLGGEDQEVNERDLFLACWHAFPNTMRWVDTALPNPDTFTASLRRLDRREYIVRAGKQDRSKGRRRKRKSILEPGRSGVVKARVAPGGLEKAAISPELIEDVRRLVPDAAATKALSEASLIALCVGLREDQGRSIDEGALVELAFHKFPDRFAYEGRPEFPDVGRVREAINTAIGEDLIDKRYRLTKAGRSLAAEGQEKLELRADVSEAHKAGDLKAADRIERTAGYQAYKEHGTLAATKGDELFRALRVPPSANPHPIANALIRRTQALRRIDKSDVADYLIALAEKHNPEVAELVQGGEREPQPS